MEIEKSIITTEVHYSEDRYHRYLLYKEWDSSLKKATIMDYSQDNRHNL